MKKRCLRCTHPQLSKLWMFISKTTWIRVNFVNSVTSALMVFSLHEVRLINGKFHIQSSFVIFFFCTYELGASQRLFVTLKLQNHKTYRRFICYIYKFWNVTAFVCYLKTPEAQDLQKIQLHIRTHHDQTSNISNQYFRKNDLNIIPNIYMLQP